MVVVFEQAQVLASAWAKEPSVQRLAVNHCLVRLESRQKISRSCLFAFCGSSILQHIPRTGFSHMSIDLDVIIPAGSWSQVFSRKMLNKLGMLSDMLVFGQRFR